MLIFFVLFFANFQKNPLNCIKPVLNCKPLLTGAYLKRRGIKGTEEVHWYDVTDYEGFHEGNRRNKSPMLSFCYLDKSNVADSTTKEFYQAGVFDNWLMAKHHTNRIFLGIWCVMRLWNLALFYAFDLGVYYAGSNIKSITRYNSSTNTTQVVTVDKSYFTRCRGNLIDNITLQRMILTIVLVQNILQMLYDIIEFFCGCVYRRNTWYKWTEKGRKKLAVQILFYRIMQFCGEVGMSMGTLTGLYFSVIGESLIKGVTGEGLINSTIFLKMMYLQISIGVTWSLLYFIQLNPWVGKMVVTIQLMVKDLIKFIAVYILILVMFSHAFLRLVSEGTNVTGNCSKYFASIPDAWYR